MRTGAGARLVLAGLAMVVAIAPAWAQAPIRVAPMRVALVPLDDRPVCLQYPELMAPLGNARIVAPPPAVLGRFTQPGDTAAVAQWLATLDLTSIDAIIVSVDMLAYGGLVASRVHAVDAAVARSRLAVLRQIRRRRPELPIYGFSVVMRLAPTADGSNEAWRSQLARWAEIAPDAPRDPDVARELATLEEAIPAPALAAYRDARRRNLQINHASLDLVADGIFTHLVLSQDDARPRGLHVAERASLAAAIRERSLTGRVGVQPGADEVAMLLLARAVLARHRLRPLIQPVYSSERTPSLVAPFEDRPLHETVSFQIETAGAEAVSDEAAELALVVFASRHETGAPVRTAGEVSRLLDAGRRVIVADVDPKGDVQGASVPFTEALVASGALPRLYGYASWNTAGNTIGTAIAHGLLHHAGMTQAGRCRSDRWDAVAQAQVRFLLHRVVNDYAYQGRVRPQINEDLRAAGRSTVTLGESSGDVARQLAERLDTELRRLAGAWIDRPLPLGPPREPLFRARLRRVGPVTVALPWARTFEARVDLDLDIDVEQIDAGRPACGAADR